MKQPYRTISRKYRPQDFASITGQEVIIKTLKNALRLGKIAHAYLFCGSRGTGKTTLARVFAKALHCSNLQKECEPCNTCESCTNISLGRCLDILEIDGASHRGIDDIREINETTLYATSSGKYKIYLIDEVHMLTKEAFNALLKTLEEPPEKVVFFFATTEPHKVPATIMSRCQRFDLRRLSLEEISQKLSRIAKDLEVHVDEEGLKLIAQSSEGSLRDAESLFDQIVCLAEGPLSLAMVRDYLGLLPTETFFSLDTAIQKEDYSFALELAGEIFSSGKDLGHFIEQLLHHFRLHLLMKLSPKDPSLGLLCEKERIQYEKNHTLYSQDQCLYIIDILLQRLQDIQKTPFKRVSLEALLFHLIHNRNRISLPELVQRLFSLEKSLSSESGVQEEMPALSKLTLSQPVMQEAPLPKIDLPKPVFVEASIPVETTLAKEPEVKIAPVEVRLPQKEDKAPEIDKHKLETLLRFTAVELEGTVIKDQKLK